MKIPLNRAAKRQEIMRLSKRHKAPEGECTYCDRERAENNNYHPSHDASERCESGKHSHCSCDTCF
jgi:hypothetical protein